MKADIDFHYKMNKRNGSNIIILSLVPRPTRAMRANRATSQRLGTERDSARPGKKWQKTPWFGRKTPWFCWRQTCLLLKNYCMYLMYDQSAMLLERWRTFYTSCSVRIYSDEEDFFDSSGLERTSRRCSLACFPSNMKWWKWYKAMVRTVNLWPDWKIAFQK